jgi:hypothetical protein
MFEVPTMSDEEASKPVTTENSEALSPEALVAGANSFEALVTVVEGIGSIAGGRKTYSAQEMVALINEARETGDISRITKTYGLREKVGDLLIVEAGK